MNEPSIVQHLKKQAEGMLRRGEFAFINKNEIGELVAFIDALCEERDEARREVCAFVSGRYSKDVVTLDRAATIAEAKMRGWDCFKENNDNSKPSND